MYPLWVFIVLFHFPKVIYASQVFWWVYNMNLLFMESVNKGVHIRILEGVTINFF